MRALAGLFNNETVTVFAGDSPPECLGCPCAPPISVSNGNSVYVPESVFTGWGSDLYVVIVHELAHIVDWHSSVGGRSYSAVWGNRTPLTDYARTGTQPWDRFAEAATFFVLGRGTGVTESGINGSPVLSSQMSDMRRLLEHWE